MTVCHKPVISANKGENFTQARFRGSLNILDILDILDNLRYIGYRGYRHSLHWALKVTFFPDFPKFGMRALEEDIVALMRRRAFDVAASTRQRCSVILDGQRLEVSCFQASCHACFNSFEDYVDLFLEPNGFRACQAHA